VTDANLATCQTGKPDKRVHLLSVHAQLLLCIDGRHLPVIFVPVQIGYRISELIVGRRTCQLHDDIAMQRLYSRNSFRYLNVQQQMIVS
jgi:hypothetical protein